jgi:hypothetical protein
LRKKLFASAVLVLVAGLAGACWIYAKAGDSPDLSGAYQIIVVDGVPRPIAPNESKAYQRDLQRYGGKMAVIFDDIGRWWDGLWHGKSLALTVGFLASIASLALYFVALAVE